MKPITFVPQGSSRISQMVFLPNREANGQCIGDLLVTFINRGSVYKYYEINKSRFDKICTAESVGKAFQEIVNDKSIKYEKIR